MSFLPGNELTASDQRNALNWYVNRYTKDHTPLWVKCLTVNGDEYQVLFDSDDDWLANTDFRVTKKGRLDKKSRACFSSPTFPDREFDITEY